MVKLNVAFHVRHIALHWRIWALRKRVGEVEPFALCRWHFNNKNNFFFTEKNSLQLIFVLRDFYLGVWKVIFGFLKKIRKDQWRRILLWKKINFLQSYLHSLDWITDNRIIHSLRSDCTQRIIHRLLLSFGHCYYDCVKKGCGYNSTNKSTSVISI